MRTRNVKRGGQTMRAARIVEECGACYHVMSRVIDRRMILDDGEKERLVELMRKIAAFSGIQILTFAIPDNHFHARDHAPDSMSIMCWSLSRFPIMSLRLASWRASTSAGALVTKS